LTPLFRDELAPTGSCYTIARKYVLVKQRRTVMDLQLGGKHALVTGSTASIGFAAARGWPSRAPRW
jgi:hypothetical protein